ncbi:MAG: protein kinase [Planctomycetes bacterium]|nr:protein kinase [Planctomycetota bacterium]
MSTTLQCNDEIFPGYTLTDRLGSGGYAEVWRARAPGGIDKAIKFVYGYYDEDLATQELKAMERIKDVRHPFLLSLERFEVVNGRLVILTELADMSLDQRARQCRAEGLDGIPREELLRYLADTAEALDYLAQRHGLQHLDVKPENLLISGDHIKVADFGLVKELTTRSQNSLVSGMTPTYASPEMFDDTPSPHSDQYSLAIVYQEMLAGALPFPGRTAAQLAKQHTQAQPQLMALPSHDRPIVARALAKNPAERFPSCRAFADALLRATMPTFPAADQASGEPLAAGVTPVSQLDDTDCGSFGTIQRPMLLCESVRTQPIGRGREEGSAASSQFADAVVDQPADREIIDVAAPALDLPLDCRQPTLYVAIGGVGIQLLCRLRQLLADPMDLDPAEDTQQMLALDTDRNELKQACAGHWKNPLLLDDTLHLPLRLPKSYDEECRESLAWLSRRWLYNIPRSLETRGYRPLGRVALVDHGQKVRSALDKRLARLRQGVSNPEACQEQSRQPIRVVLLSGMGGGTGAGMVIDVANAARSLAIAGGTDVEVHGILLCTCLGNPSPSPLAAANTFALITELRHASEFGNRGTTRNEGILKLFDSSTPPFDAVYCVSVRTRSASPGVHDDLESVAQYLATEATTAVRNALRAFRQSPTPREAEQPGQLRLRTLGCVSLSEEKRQVFQRVAGELARAVKQYWLSEAAADEWPTAGDDRGSSDKLPEATDASESVAAMQGISSPTSNGLTLNKLCSRFGNYASTRFACQAITCVMQRMAAKGERDAAVFTPRNALALIGTLGSALETVAAGRTTPDNGENGKPPAIAFEELVTEGSRLVLDRLIGEFDPAQSAPTRVVESLQAILADTCVHLLEQDLNRSTGSNAAAVFQHDESYIDHSLERASTNLLQCGYDRRTLVLISSKSDREIAEVLQAKRAMAAILPAEVADEIILCEGTGISPRILAAGLAKVYPDIAEAAGRLFTRVDIEWKSLV